MRSSVAQIKDVTPVHSKGDQYTSAWAQKVSMIVIEWSPNSILSPYIHLSQSRVLLRTVSPSHGPLRVRTHVRALQCYDVIGADGYTVESRFPPTYFFFKRRDNRTSQDSEMGIDLATWRARIGLNYYHQCRYACRPLPVQWRAARWGAVAGSIPLLFGREECLAFR